MTTNWTASTFESEMDPTTKAKVAVAAVAAAAAAVAADLAAVTAGANARPAGQEAQRKTTAEVAPGAQRKAKTAEAAPGALLVKTAGAVRKVAAQERKRSELVFSTSSPVLFFLFIVGVML
mmetsp:Transcript_22912/g.32348  ORF Transcript_22912/g.32348 Transcript_22912/m.32348 type:complete len:121 (-) Transcript_22912:310-672(-)